MPNLFRRAALYQFKMPKPLPQFEQDADRHVRLLRVDDRADVTITKHESGRLKVRSEKWAGRAWMDLLPAGQTLRTGRPWQVSAQGDRLEIDCEARRGKGVRGVTHRFRPGSFEWEEIFASAADLPETPYVAYDVSTPPGLTFHFQPPLTAEEIAEGCERPDNVVGSYAVYWSESGRILRPDGSERVNYETGKFAHIYRPRWIDDAGAWCWGQQTITGSQLRIAVPAEWIGSAERRWPVTLDPIFGYSAEPNSSIGSFTARCNQAVSTRRTASAGDTIVQFSAWASASATRTLYLAAYSYTTKPVNRLADVVNVPLDSTTKILVNSDAVSQSMVAGTSYCVAEGMSAITTVYYDSGSPADALTGLSGSLPDPWGGTSWTARKYGFYATYTEAAATKYWLRSGRSRIFGGGII